MPLPRRAGAAALLAVALGSSASFATVVPGGSLVTQTWSPAGNPYQVMGDVTIPTGATLTIDAGTVVQLATSDDQAAGADAARVEVIVEGALDVNGTPGSPVAFESMGVPSTFGWYGIRVLPAASSCDLSNFTFRHASAGIFNQGAASVLALTNADIGFCNHDLSTGVGITLSGTLRASRISGPLTVPSGARFEHSGVPGGTVGALTMAPGSTYAATVRGQFDTDRLFALGPLSLAGTLELDVSACTLTSGQTSFLFAVNPPGPVGAFDSHPEGSYIPVAGALALRVSYVLATGNDVGVVPEEVVGIPPPAPRGVLGILAARPNPATGPQAFRVEIPVGTSGARFEIFDLSGRRIWRAPDSAIAAGSGEIGWDGRDEGGRAVESGVYLARLVADREVASGRRFVRTR